MGHDFRRSRRLNRLKKGEVAGAGHATAKTNDQANPGKVYSMEAHGAPENVSASSAGQPQKEERKNYFQLSHEYHMTFTDRTFIN
jgi:hypothetical protein